MKKLWGSKRNKKISIRSALLAFTISIVLALCMVIMVSNYVTLQQVMSEYVDVFVDQTMESVTSEINSSAQYVNSLIQSIVNSRELNQYIRAENSLGKKERSEMTEAEYYQELSFLRRSIFSFYDDRERVPFVFLSFNGKAYCFGDIGNPAIYEGLSEKINQARTSEDAQVAVHAQVNQKDMVLISRHIADIQSGEPILDVVIALNVGKFSTILSDGIIGEDGKLKLIGQDTQVLHPVSTLEDDRWDEVVACLKQQEWLRGRGSRSISFRAGQLQIFASRINLNNWSVIGYLSTDSVMRHVFDPVSFVTIPMACMLMAAVFCIWISRQITNPIQKIVHAMKKADESGFDGDVEFVQSFFSETNYISSQFNDMMRHIRRLITEVHNAELERKDAELASLQAQIRPHFIYNTLENINMMLIMRGQNDISRVVINLSDILRYNINPNQKDVMLCEDIEQVEKYLHIQQFRFGDKLHYHVDVLSETQNLVIEKLLIQPIVENAVIHGIGKKPDGGTIWIRSWIEGSNLLIRIADDGIGYTPDMQAVAKQHSAFGKGGHIGLGNVQNRIRNRYGEAYGLRFEQRDVGTSIVIVLPVAYCG